MAFPSLLTALWPPLAARRCGGSFLSLCSCSVLCAQKIQRQASLDFLCFFCALLYWMVWLTLFCFTFYVFFSFLLFFVSCSSSLYFFILVLLVLTFFYSYLLIYFFALTIIFSECLLCTVTHYLSTSYSSFIFPFFMLLSPLQSSFLLWNNSDSVRFYFLQRQKIIEDFFRSSLADELSLIVFQRTSFVSTMDVSAPSSSLLQYLSNDSTWQSYLFLWLNLKRLSPQHCLLLSSPFR